MPRFFNTTVVIVVAMVCWSAMAIGGVDDSKLSSFTGATVAIVLAYILFF